MVGREGVKGECRITGLGQTYGNVKGGNLASSKNAPKMDHLSDRGATRKEQIRDLLGWPEKTRGEVETGTPSKNSGSDMGRNMWCKTGRGDLQKILGKAHGHRGGKFPNLKKTGSKKGGTSSVSGKKTNNNEG